MPTLLHPTDTDQRPSTDGGGIWPRPPRTFGGGGGGLPDGYDPRSGEKLILAVWVGIAGIVMFFAAIVSAMAVRRAGDDWRTLEVPEILWFSTALLIISSIAFEPARRAKPFSTGSRVWMSLTAVLGVAFLVAQYAGWRDLLNQGVTVTSTPSASFFYLFTAAHAIHVAGGLLVLAYVTARVWMSTPWPSRPYALNGAAIYWHFMDLLWLVLFGLLLYWG